MGKRALASGLVFIAAAWWLWPGTAHADPGNGMGLYLGPVYSHFPSRYTGRGLSLGADAQMAINENWSFNPYIEITYERTDQPYAILNGAAGLQARRWSGHWFLGAQFLYHDELVRNAGSISASTYGPALGFAVGWEPGSRWSVVFEANGFESQGNLGWSTRYHRDDYRVVAGYHWY